MMAHTRHASGASQTFVEAMWRGFVDEALDVTVEAYERLGVRAPAAWQGKQEGTFTVNLKMVIDEIVRERSLAWVCPIESPELISEMQSGAVPLKHAKRTDMTIIEVVPGTDYARFVFECKRLHQRNITYSKEYVDHGMARFIVEESYASGLADAGMIGYILCGTPAELAEQINGYLMHVLTTEECLLRDTAPLRSLETYTSAHTCRRSHRDLRLHHLLLPFDTSPQV